MGREIRQLNLGLVTAATSSVSSAAFAVFALLALTHWVAGGVLLVLGIGPVIAGSLFVGKAEKKYREELVAQRTRAAEERAEQARHKAIESLCHVTHRFLKVDSTNDLRVTLLEADKSGEVATLRQVARCQTDGPCELTGSSMTIHQGVAGRSFCKVASVTVNVKGGEFIQTMLDFGFTKEEAKLFEERGSYLCCPVVNDRTEVLGVLSLDAVNPGVFDADKSEIAQQVTPLFAQWLTDPDREERDA